MRGPAPAILLSFQSFTVLSANETHALCGVHWPPEMLIILRGHKSARKSHHDSTWVPLIICILLSLGTGATAKANNRSAWVCENPAQDLASFTCGQQSLAILRITTLSQCNDGESTPSACGVDADTAVTSVLKGQCSTGASICEFSMKTIHAETAKKNANCNFVGLRADLACDDGSYFGPGVVGTTVAPDEWWKNYGSWQFIVIWCVIGCVIIIVVITILLLMCGCCPRCCHRYEEPNTLSKLALMTLSSIERTTTIEFGADSAFSLTRDARGQSDGGSDSSGGAGGTDGRGTPDGGSSVVLGSAKLGGQMSGSQSTLERSSAYGGRQGMAGGSSDITVSRGGRVTTAQSFSSDKMSTLSRQSENGYATGRRSPSSLLGSTAAGTGTLGGSVASTLSRSRETLTKQGSSQDSGIGGGGFDEPDVSGIEFGTKKRGKNDPQPAYFGQKGITMPSDVSAQSSSTLRRPGTGSSAGDGGRPRGLFQKNTATLKGGDLASPGDSRSFCDPSATLPGGGTGSGASTARRGSAFSALTDLDPAQAAAQRSATLSRLHSRSKSAIALMGVDDSLHALRVSTLTREKTKTQESSRSVTMSLEEALTAGRLGAGAAAAPSPAWSGVIAAATLPRTRPAAPASEAAEEGPSANGATTQAAP